MCTNWCLCQQFANGTQNKATWSVFAQGVFGMNLDGSRSYFLICPKVDRQHLMLCLNTVHSTYIINNQLDYNFTHMCHIMFIACGDTYTGYSAPRIFGLKENREISNKDGFWYKVFQLYSSSTDGWEEFYWCFYEGLQKSTRNFVIQHVFCIKEFHENFSFTTSLGAELRVYNHFLLLCTCSHFNNFINKQSALNNYWKRQCEKLWNKLKSNHNSHSTKEPNKYINY